MEQLTSNEVKWIKSLKLKKFREQEKCFVIEGEKLIAEALEKHPAAIKMVVVASEKVPFNNLALPLLRKSTTKQMQQISSLKTPSSALAVLSYLSVSQHSSFILAIDGIQNPGNLGTIIRSAAWFGCTKIIASADTVDKFNPKVIQATMGSIFDVEVTYCNLPEYLAQQELPVYGADMKGESIYELPKMDHAIIVMGSEGKGISPAVKAFTQLISIPRTGYGESLNVAMASGIILSEFTRKLGI
jgi:TrmH family RNA methyltransferase